MSTVTLTTTPTILDAGTAYDLSLVNSGSLSIHVEISGGSLGLLYHEILRPKQQVTVYPHGYPVSAFTDSGTSSVDVTLGDNPQLNATREATQDALAAGALVKTANLSDLANAGTARTNLGLGTAATHPDTDFLTSSAASATYPLIGKGYSIPVGSLDIWRAARDASASTLCEVVGIGDSLTRGEGPTAGLYGPSQRLREKSVAAGFADGKRGYNNTVFGETLDNYVGEVAPVSARTGFNLTGSFGMPYAQYSDTAGDTVTFKVQAPRARLWWARYLQAGGFSYAVNGGAPVTVASGYIDAPPRGAGTGYGSQNPEYILFGLADGMTATGTNTIVVTNLGGHPLGAPVLGNINAEGSGTGNVAAGTYDFVVTRAGAGETLPSAPLTFTVGAGGQKLDLYTAVPASVPYDGTYNIYRRVNGSGTAYGYVGQVVNGNPNSNFIGNDNTASPNMAINPPTVSTFTGRDAYANVAVNIEAIGNTGIVWHNNGISGATIGSFVDTDDLYFNSNTALALLGVQWGTGSNGIAVATPADVLPSAAHSGTTTPLDPATARKPKLVILAFGTNDARVDWTITAPPAGSAAVGSTGTVPAATYYYKFKRATAGSPSGIGPASPASAGVTVDGTKQIVVTAPASAQGGPGYPPLFSVYRATSSGGTYSFVGQVSGFGGTFLDNVTNLGPTMPADSTSEQNAMVYVDSITADFALAIQVIRNAGADPLIVLPAVQLLAQQGANRGVVHVVKQAIKNVAETYSCAWVDWDIALGPAADRVAAGYGSGDTNPHLPKPAQIAKADFLWNNVLSR